MSTEGVNINKAYLRPPSASTGYITEIDDLVFQLESVPGAKLHLDVAFWDNEGMYSLSPYRFVHPNARQSQSDPRPAFSQFLDSLALQEFNIEEEKK
jgi:hypothetical protein